MSQEEKVFPAGMEPLGSNPFHFHCNPTVPCFTRCCRNLDLFLYPNDIIKLKARLGLTSEEFLRRHTAAVRRDNPYFPALMLRMREDEDKTCPFLESDGCSVYSDRPSACRTYPLERAIDRTPKRGQPREYYFLTHHPYCLGHGQDRQYTVREWLRDQNLLIYNLMDDLWAELDTLFRGNPWQGEGVGGPRQQIAFMVCYNIDGFRHYVSEHKILEGLKLSRSRQRELAGSDEELLQFGFTWLRSLLTGTPFHNNR